MPAKKQEVLTEAQVDEEVLRYEKRLAALKDFYKDRENEVAEVEAERDELREAFRLLEEAFLGARHERFDIISDFTRQYKSTEDELIARCTDLDNAITDLRDQQELAKLALAETTKELEHYAQMKEREYQEQETRIQEMETEFTIMLNETQERMTDAVAHDASRGDGGDEEDEDEG